MKTNTIIQGDCIEELKKLPENSVDAIITDPPYGLAFMGKEWDTFNEYSQEKQTKPEDYKSVGRVRYYRKDGKPVYWNKPTYVPKEFKFIGKNQDKKNELMENFFYYWATECLRVLKPGGFLLSFGGTRTYHRLACGIEDAGFEIRDCIMWLYGSGFPKSLNIGKQIDKRKDWKKLKEIQDVVKEARNKSGKTTKQVGEECNEKHWYRGGYCFFETGFILPTKEQWIKLKKCLNISDEYDNVFEEAEREVIRKGQAKFFEKNNVFELNNEGYGNYDLTAPATPEAKEWEGWGTALKPAVEPIVVARKPLSEKNVALNVLKWGTGGINIDDCRIGSEIRTNKGMSARQPDCAGTFRDDNWKPKKVENIAQGRFPANIILDEEAGRMLDEQSGILGSNSLAIRKTANSGGTGNCYKTSNDVPGNIVSIRGKGGASRFFYCAKASKSERNYGLENKEEKLDCDRNPDCYSADVLFNRSSNPKKNNHPTVKPIKLMEYLIKLVSKKGAIVLDTFLGSGTTAIACLKQNRKFIGIEKEEEYIKIAQARIKPFLEQKRLEL